jgi:cyclophilin family peptidyl-prolyl cis-trans isomerase
MNRVLYLLLPLTLLACEKSEGPPKQGVSREEIEGKGYKERKAAAGRRAPSTPAAPDGHGADPHGKAAKAAKPGTRAPTAADLATYTKDLPGTGALIATIETNHGTIHCELYGDKTPMTVANFVGLATGKHPWWSDKAGKAMTGSPYFDGLTFHRVIPEFMIQGGDIAGTGAGGPGYEFADEIVPSLRHDRPGILSMANAGKGTNGSQFFITEVPTPQLDKKHTVFGHCKEIDLVKKIARVPTSSGDKPVEPVVMKKVTISKGAL